MAEKSLIWIGSSLEDLRAFPAEARREAGYQLRRVQSGLMPNDWKPIKAVGLGVYEIRIHTGIEHRVFYLARFSEGVYVLAAFEKRTRQTPQSEINLARKRFGEIQKFRGKHREQ